MVTSGALAPVPELPDAVRKTIAERFPDAVVRRVERDYALGIALFEVELAGGDGEAEAVISADGVLVQVYSPPRIDARLVNGRGALRLCLRG